MSIIKHVKRERGKDFMLIRVEIREDHQDLSDGFSITAELYKSHGKQSGRVRYLGLRAPDECGMLHEQILKFAPELAPVIEVHLANLDGVPLHAVTNGWYFYSGNARKHEMEQVSKGRYWNARYYESSDLQRAAQALHIDPEDLPAGLDEPGFVRFAESLREHWAEQARAARAVIESL